MRIVLDLPPRELSPNARVHWAKLAKAKKFYRKLAWVSAMNQPRYLRAKWEHAEAQATFYLPDARRRDGDNLAAMLKAAWDGIVDAEILADDCGLKIHPPLLVIDRARPRVEIEILPITEESAA